jgi:predicted AAA+ superfamily ATPase
MTLLASSSGQILNQTNIARAAAISQATVGRYLGLLETMGGLEREVDFVVEWGGRSVAIEVKSSNHASLKDTESMLALKDLLPKWSHGMVLYNGAKVVKLGDRIYGLPMSMI